MRKFYYGDEEATGYGSGADTKAYWHEHLPKGSGQGRTTEHFNSAGRGLYTEIVGRETALYTGSTAPSETSDLVGSDNPLNQFPADPEWIHCWGHHA